MKKTRIRTKKNLRKAITFKPTETNRLELDKYIFDVAMKCLYHNADKSELGFETEILKYAKVKLPQKEISRLWNVLASSNWVAPTVGFGRAGKLELTHAGYQLMSQFGGYKQYLDTVENNQKPQTIIMPFQVEDDSAENEAKKEEPKA